MKKFHIDKAYFIKLGQNGKWEESSINDAKMRIGWSLQDTDDMTAGRIAVLRERKSSGQHTPGSVTRELNQLRLICESTPQDVWVTFYSSRLWWCRVKSAKVSADDVSSFREVDGWSHVDIRGNDLLINRIPGEVSKIQRYQGTVCRVRGRGRDSLSRLLNDEPSSEYQQIETSRKLLIDVVAHGIKKLHWKDFELFVDLLFRGSGWRRVSMLGETMKYVDLELEDPITHDQYQVQVKSLASLAEFDVYSKQFRGGRFRKFFFVVHTPDAALAAMQGGTTDVELVLPSRLLEMAVDLGLVDWLMHRIK